MKVRNQKKLVSIIAAHMVDFSPDTKAVRGLVFRPWGGSKHKYGRHCAGLLEVFTPAIAWRMVRHGANPAKDVDHLGREVLFAIAHEFRHSQQILDGWDGATVLDAAKDDQTAYLTDPGEADANAFATMVVIQEEPKFIRHLGRYAQWVCRHQWAEFKAAATDHTKQKGE